VLYWLVLSHPDLDIRVKNDLILKLRQLPDKVKEILITEERIAVQAESLAKFENIFFIGRGINLAIALEGALKLKEVSYIHSEAYPAGELKHGPFALLSRDTPVVAIIGNDKSLAAMLTNVKEIKSRGSPVFAICEEGSEVIWDMADVVMTVPRIDPILSPFLNTIVVQLLAYYAARKRNCPIDFPRNLAKSVTVE
jgi:glucosamine--fructose-6-phosphate aminotransferase (isomerizing)